MGESGHSNSTALGLPYQKKQLPATEWETWSVHSFTAPHRMVLGVCLSSPSRECLTSRNLCTKLTYNCDRDPEGQQAISIKDSNWNSRNSNGCVLNFGKPGISIEQYMRCVDFIKGERWDQVSSVQLKFKFIRLKENVKI